MPLRYRYNNTNYICYYYPNKSDIRGDGVEENKMLHLKINGSIYYIGLTSNLNHPLASHLRVRVDETNYAVLTHSKETIVTIEDGQGDYEGEDDYDYDEDEDDEGED